MSILKRWDEDYNNNSGIPWSEFVKTVDKSNYSPELFNDNGSGENDDEDLFPEDDNLYSDEEIANWEKERAGNAKASKDVTFITVHPNGGEGHVIALDDEKNVVSPDAGEFKGTTLSSAKSVGLDELEKKSLEKSGKKGKSKSADNDDEPTGVEKGSKEYYQAKVDKYEKRLKMYAMKIEDLQKKIDSGDNSAADELEKYKARQARVEKKLAGYKKNLEKFNTNESTIGLSSAKSTTGSKDKEYSKEKTASKESIGDTSSYTVKDADKKIAAIQSAMAMPGDMNWEEASEYNIKKVNKRITPWTEESAPDDYKDAIKYYTKGDYRSFNWAVTGSSYTDVSSAINAKNAQRLDRLFKDPKCKTYGDAVLFRSMNSRHLPKDFFDGAPYVDSQIVSTSAAHALTHIWHKSNKCELAIYLPKGSTAANISKLGVHEEQETLLPPNTVYKFIGIVGYRQSNIESSPHPIYAVEAYTPNSTNLYNTIKENKRLLEEVRDSGRMPSEFHKGIYNLAEELATKRVSFPYVSKQLGDGVSEENVWEYYNKYKNLFTGGSATPKGSHSDWKQQLKISGLQSSKSQPTVASKANPDKVQKSVDILKHALDNIGSVKSVHSLYLDVSDNLPLEDNLMGSFYKLKKEATNLGYEYNSLDYNSYIISGMLDHVSSKYGVSLSDGKTSKLKKSASKKV